MALTGEGLGPLHVDLLVKASLELQVQHNLLSVPCSISQCVDYIGVFRYAVEGHLDPLDRPIQSCFT